MFSKTFFAALASVAAAAVVQAAPTAFSGDATFYYPNGGYGACGNPIQNTDYAVALNTDSYASGANCGRQISVSYQGKSVTATVADLCPGCGAGGVDLTPTAFEQLADLSVGRIAVTWDFI